MNRFFVEPPKISGGIIRLTPEDMAHIRVLRLRPDEFFCVCDGAGYDYICKLIPNTDSAEIISSHASTGEPAVKCTVFAAFSKGDKLETVVQKSVELGAYDIAVFPSARCISVPDEKSRAKKITRLQKIALEAAKQSGRGIIPAVRAFDSFQNAISTASDSQLALFCYELENANSITRAIAIKSAAGNIKTAAIVTGPEGGFTPEEAELSADRGLIPVSLGPRILRCETAPVFALSAVMLCVENL